MDKKKSRYSFQDSANAFLAVILAQIVFLLVYSMIIASISESTGMAVEEITGAEICIYLNMILSEGIFFLVYLFYNIATQKSGFKQASRLNKKFDWKVLLLVVGLSIVAVFGFNHFIELVNHILTDVLGLSSGAGIDYVIDTPLKFIIATVLMAVFPAVFEELVFRGIIFNGLREKLSPRKAIILCSILFALMHMSIYKTVYQIVLGLMLSIIVYYTGSIVYSMVFHFVNNFVIVLLNYITTITGSDAFTYTTWAAGDIVKAVGVMLISTAVLVVGCYFLGKYCKKQPDFDKDHKETYGDIEDAEEEANFVAGTDVTGLSDYEVKQLGSTMFITAKGWLIISMVIAGFLWFVSSFLGG
jgi:membrane protease YdiL (CAAX protease family)